MTTVKKGLGGRIAPWLKTRFVLPGAGVLAILLFLFVRGLFVAPSTIPTYTVKRGDLEISVTESGELRAKKTVSIVAPMARMAKLKIIYLVPEGTYVEPGTVVVRFDPSEALNEVKKADAELELANSERAKLEARHKLESAQMDSQLKAAELGYQLSKLRLEQIKFEAKVRQDEALLSNKLDEMKFQDIQQECESKKIIQRSEMEKADLEARQKRDDLVKARETLKALSLVSDTKGLVVYGLNYQNQGRKFAVGDDVWGAAPIIEVPDLSAMESIAYINEIDIGKIEPGQSVIVRLDALREQTFAGAVSFVAPLGNRRRSNIKVFEVLVDIKNGSGVLKPGMTTSNKIIVNELKDVFFVPLDAVFGKEGDSHVYVRNGSRFHQRSVVLGDKSDDYAVIKEGLTEGEIVALLDPFAEPQDRLTTPGPAAPEMPGEKR
jgi:multidrug efflux pump subunit AcrA (membrane-fusion protein)